MAEQDINEVQKISAPVPSVKPVAAAKPTAEAELAALQKEALENEIKLQRMKLAAQQAELDDLKARAEARELELQERRANLVDLKERLDERQLKRANRDQVFRGHGQNLKQDAANMAAKQAHCNHRKGGDGANGVIGGQGDDMQYCIARHKMANEDVWVRCLRCGKLWKPPVMSDFFSKRPVSVQEGRVENKHYDFAWREYEEAMKFPTRNHTSGTHTFLWGDVTSAEGNREGGAEHYREKMKNVTLA